MDENKRLYFVKAKRIARILIAVRDLRVASRLLSDLPGFDEARGDERQKVKYTPSATGLELNRIGIVLLGTLNPVAAAEEAGIGAENRAMSAVVE